VDLKSQSGGALRTPTLSRVSEVPQVPIGLEGEEESLIKEEEKEERSLMSSTFLGLPSLFESALIALSPSQEINFVLPFPLLMPRK